MGLVHDHRGGKEYGQQAGRDGAEPVAESSSWWEPISQVSEEGWLLSVPSLWDLRGRKMATQTL